MRLLPLLLAPVIPWATRWVYEQEALIIKEGRSLTSYQIADAVQSGVAAPEKIYVKVVPAIQPPNHWLLSVLSRFIKLIGPLTGGLTLNYGIFIREDCSDYHRYRELYVHEFVHVGQYERLGSVKAFLTAYLAECLVPGYPLGPMEQEAVRKAATIAHGK